MTKQIKRSYVLIGLVSIFIVSATVWSVDTNIFKFVSSHTSSFENFISINPILSALIFVGIYIIILGIGLPLASFLNVTTGYFFGGYDGGIVAFFGLSLSASFTYWLGRTYVFNWLHRHHTRRLEIIKKELDKNGALYVLAVRISSIFPFFWVNLLFGASGLKWRHYMLPTILGMIPGVFLSIYIGTKLANLDTLSMVLEPSMSLAFLFLGLFILLFVYTKRFKKHN